MRSAPEQLKRVIVRGDFGGGGDISLRLLRVRHSECNLMALTEPYAAQRSANIARPKHCNSTHVGYDTADYGRKNQPNGQVSGFGDGSRTLYFAGYCLANLLRGL
jgi:hypothetical protein